MNKRKIKIAVIDTGADMHDKEINDNLKFDIKLQSDDFRKKYKNIDDINGHGTLCIKTILSICNDALVYPIKIFDNHGKTSSWNLEEVLRKILYTDIDIVNISASTTSCPCEEELEEVCKRLYEEGKIIICSHHNENNTKSSIPTKFSTVLGVKGIDEVFEDNDYIYTKCNEVQIYGNSKDKLFEFKGDIRKFGKNSRAASVFSGIVANFMKENEYKTNGIENLIIKNSMNIKKIMDNTNQLNNIDYDEDKIKIAEKIVLLINNEFSVRNVDLKFIDEYSLFNNFTGIGNHNAYEFLTKINEVFKINIDYKEIFIYDLEYLKNIIEIIQVNLKKEKILTY